MNKVVSKDHAMINGVRTPIAGCLESECNMACLRRDDQIAVKLGRSGCRHSEQKPYYIPMNSNE